jgi:hypothetical protein
MRHGGRLQSILLAALTAGCTSFENVTTVIDTRVLAIRTEPSEVILEADLSDLAMPVLDPASNLPITITPLVAGPPGGAAPRATYTVFACPNDAFGPAPPRSGGGALPSGGARTSVGSAPCDEASPTTWRLTPAPLPASESVTVQISEEQLVTAFRTDLFPDQLGHLHGGFDLGMPLTFDLRIEADGERLIAIKRVLYWAARINDQHLPNRSPTIPELRLYEARDEETGELLGPPRPLLPNEPFDVLAGSKPWIEPALDPATAEPYQTTVLDAATHLAVPHSVPRETIRYAFYATAGSFARARTSSELAEGYVGRPQLESQYTAPVDLDALPPDRLVTIWVVVRDDRGGESWERRELRIVSP